MQAQEKGKCFFLLCLCLFQASSHQWNKRNKHKRKHKKTENVSFSCAYACAYFTSVHTSIFLCLCLCLSHKCEPGLNGLVGCFYIIAVCFRVSYNQTKWDGVNGVNRLATKGEKALLTTDKRRENITDYRQTRKKLPTSEKKITEIYRQPTKVENFNRQPTK